MIIKQIYNNIKYVFIWGYLLKKFLYVNKYNKNLKCPAHKQCFRNTIKPVCVIVCYTHLPLSTVMLL